VLLDRKIFVKNREKKNECLTIYNGFDPYHRFLNALIEREEKEKFCII
jgi:hypothetical protein